MKDDVRTWQKEVLRDVPWRYISAPEANGNVLILHSYRECHDSLAEVMQYWWNKGYHVATCDLPGHGPKANGDAGYFDHMQQHVDIAHALILKMWEEAELPIYLVGNSMGALAELLLLLQQQEIREHLVKGVVTINVPVNVVGTRRSGWTPVYVLSTGLALMSFVAGRWHVPHRFIGEKQTASTLMQVTMSSWCHRDLVPYRVAYEFFRTTTYLQEHIALLDSVPILAFQSTKDTTAGYETARRLLGSLRNTEFHELKNAGHSILHDMFLVKEILDATGNWLDRQRAGSETMASHG